MNARARHERRRLQTLAHPCWCPVHRGANSPKHYGHALSSEGWTGLWRQVGGYTETGPWFDESGQIADPTITRSRAFHGWPPKKLRITRRIRELRAESRRGERLARQAGRNPKFPAKAYLVALAGWHAAGAIVTESGPVYRARVDGAPKR